MAEATDMVARRTAAPKRHSVVVDLLIRLGKEKPLGTAGGVIVLVMFLAGIFADILAPYGMNEAHLLDILSPPSAKYVMGTDNLGRDMLTRIIYGARISMIVGLAAPAIHVVVSALIGATSGYMGGKYDLIMQRFVDAWMCFPGLIIMLTVMALVGPGLGQVIFVLGISGGIGGSRTIRGAVIGIKQNMYVEAARSIGCTTNRILLRHLLPNVMPMIIVIFTIGMGSAILAEATLSFLGYGIPPPQPSWGGMLSGPGRYKMTTAPWMALWPGLALAIVVWGINMLGDAVRDILDPRLRGGVGRYAGAKAKKGPAKGQTRAKRERYQAI